MSIRGFGNQTVTGAAQPLLGTLLTAPAVISPDQATGRIAAGNANSSSVLTVTAGTTSLFRKGDRVLLGPTSSFTPTNTTAAADQATVQSVNTAANQLTVNGLQKQHATGEWVIVSLQAARVRLLTNTSSIYLGGDSTVSSTSTTLADVLLPGATYDIGPSAIANVYGTAGYWVQGTASDSYLPSIETI